ncbi:MAG: zf-HC2 domain-containing protein [Deltaproteobacteria bacterium]|nr:zf-HC2 domain-containing protein [Deltaproteobacteria bacterium]
MRHASCARRLSQYADGTLPQEVFIRMDAHLATCPECRTELSQLRSTIDLLGSLASSSASAGLPTDFGEQVMARISAGEADPGVIGRFGDQWRRWMESSVGPPLLTAAFGLTLLVLVQGVEVEVSLPGFASSASAGATSIPLETAVSSRPDVSPAASPLAARRRIVALPAMPPLAACLRGAESGCGRWHAWHVGLGMREPRVFLREVENVPDRARERWLDELSRFAAHSGTASVLAARLRESGDPRAHGVATHFEQVAAIPRR